MHTPVLLQEVFEILNIEGGDSYLDATLGMGGHAEALWQKFGKKVKLAGIDADSNAVETARARLELAGAAPKFATLNFRHIAKAPEILGVQPTKILFDLGWNKSQFDTPEGESGRGFSFQRDEPLKMTFASEASDGSFTAETVVNEWDEENIRTIIDAYGEERFAHKIARAIVERRQGKPIRTSGELAEIIKGATPMWYHFKRIHPATRTFQALRIVVNDELRALEEGLHSGFDILSQGGRMAVISFHSLEDRIVKRFFKQLEDEGNAEILTKKPIEAAEAEVQVNPRSRSAKLRAVQKLKEGKIEKSKE